MLSIKSLALTGLASLIIGFIAGYSYRSDRAHIEQLEIIQATLEQENDALYSQLEKEHEYQEKQKEISAKTQDDLQALQSSYDSALADIERLRKSSANKCPATLPADTRPTAGYAETGQDKSPRSGDERYQSAIAVMNELKDCDTIAHRYNELIKLYNSIRD